MNQHEKISLAKDMERIIKKTKISNKIITEQLDYIIAELEEAKMNSDYSQIKDKLQVCSIYQQNQKPLSQVKQANKDCYAYISKMGKNMDKLYKKNLQYGQEHVQLNQQILTELIKSHLLREGEFEAYLTLVQESQSQQSKFFEFYKEILSIANDIKQQNLQSAILWAIKKDESELLFQLLKQKFVQLFQNEGKTAAINFVRNTPEMQKMIKFKMYDVFQMTSSLLEYPESQKKFKSLFDNETNWPRILNLFLETASKTQNLPTKSEIKTVFSAGCLAMPKLIKYNQVTRNRSSEVISNDIPIDIEIGREYKYHSFFVCPVSREVTKTDNPPMLLKCGHVVSKLSADKMTQSKTKFKCPTCPIESKINDLKQLIFI